MRPLIVAVLVFQAASVLAADDRPNIVFMLSDDKNWNLPARL
jgi:hypothetical protein